MHILKHSIVALLLASATFVQVAESQAASLDFQWVIMGNDGKLQYKTTPRGDRIMDYSHAGYMGGGVPIPTVPAKITLSPNPTGDDTARIQAAIDSVSQMPLVGHFRGAVLLQPGEYRCGQPLTITASGVVLRGSGKGEDGSIIEMTGAAHTCIFLGGDSYNLQLGAPIQITDDYVPSGVDHISVASTSGLSVGDRVRIQRTITAEWIAFMEMDQLVRDGLPQTWIAPGSKFSFERTITGIEGNVLILNVGLSDSIDAQYAPTDPATVQKIEHSERTSHVGVEDLRIVSLPPEGDLTVQHNQAIALGAIEDSWVRNMSSHDPVGVIGFNATTWSAAHSTRVTIQCVDAYHTKPIESGAGYPADMNILGSFYLIDRCTASGNSSKNFFYSSLGPRETAAVVLNCTFNGNGSIMPHMRWNTGFLVDSCDLPDGSIQFINRGGAGSGHGWCIGWPVAWNCTAPAVEAQQAPGTVSWMIGCKGAIQDTGDNSDIGLYPSHGTHVSPGSLYMAQLEERLDFPAPPTNLSATAGDASVGLNWADNTEPDLDSYSVYRSTTSGSYGPALASNLTSSAYVDNTVSNGILYYYAVTAVDSNSNESAQSNEALAVPADPSNQPPAFSSDSIVGVNATMGMPYSGAIADYASDPESDPMAFSKVSGPAWLSIAANGELSGALGADDLGPNSFTVQVVAAGGSDTATLEIIVAGVHSFSTSDGNVPENMLDGDTSDDSRWSASGFPQWVIFDFGRNRYLEGLSVWAYQARPYQYTLEISDNPSNNFTTVVDRSANTDATQPISDTFPPANGRYAKLTVTGVDGNITTWASITEVEFTFSATTPTVTYDGNGSDGGTAPTDPNSPYTDGATVTVLANTDLVKTGYTFAGWNTDPGGGGTAYAADDTFAITGDTTLYAQWTPVTPNTSAVTSFTLINADTDTDIQTIANGDTINLATLPSQNINIRANVDVAPTSVTITLSGATAQTTTEGFAPYALWGDTSGNYLPGSLNVGAHTLSATPLGGTAYTVNFSVIDNATGMPTANAGPDKNLTLPANSTILSGSGSDDGTITSYSWTQQSGPNTASLSGQSTATLTASSLVAGTYVMRLTVTDNDSNTAFDEAQIVVSSGAGPAPEGAFLEAGGLVVMEVESAPVVTGWESRTEIAGYKGTEYYHCMADSFSVGGNSILDYEFTVATAGDYQIQVRSRIAEGTSNTDCNDTFIRLIDSAGNPVTPIPNQNVVTATWYKYYMNVLNNWSWNTSNKDNDPHSIGWALSAGQTYTLQLSRRSKGHAVDRIVLWNKALYTYGDNSGKSSSGATLDALPESDRATAGTNIIYIGRTDFPNTSAGEVPYYEDTTRDCLAIDAANVSYRAKFARAERTFDGPLGFYDVTITTLTEEDGECTYRLLVNGAVVGTYQNPSVGAAGDSQPHTHTWTGITVNTGDTIAVESNTHSNGLIPEGAGFAWARGRWRQIEFASANGGRAADIYGELKKWHKTTIIFDGPNTSETSATNPFLDYRLNVTFSHAGSGKSYVVPGYYAADGNAAETSAGSGNKWAVHFAPDEVGEWTYAASFRTGANVAVDAGPSAGASAGFCDGAEDSFIIAASDKTGRDHRGKGRLEYVGEHYLRFAETGEFFIKQGADAPEGLLAYDDFDNTPNLAPANAPRKSWAPHAGDWNTGDPSWQGGKGTELIGAVNYIASEGMNAMSFLTDSADGDTKNVFMWLSTTDYQHYDVSKCAQWEIVFEHMDKMGIYLHFKTQETENDQKLDGGALGTNRKLYYRELIARFGHHLALNWNLGEENTNTDQQRKDFAQFFYDNDPYRHNIVVHTYPGDKNAVYTPLLGNNSKLTGASLQSDWATADSDVEYWVKQSAAAGKKWVVANDEQGSANDGIKPDSENDHDGRRKETLWGTLMSGGAGCEYYFGYSYPNSDMTCQDFRSRDQWWDYCRYAHQFFTSNDIPVQVMLNDNALSSDGNDYCFYWSNEVYVVYLKNGGTTTLDLSAASGSFEVKWFDPRNGGSLQNGSVTAVTGGGTVSLGAAPNNPSLDWAILVRRTPGSSYQLTVNNGSGGGNYLSTTAIDIAADDPPSADQIFDTWTGDAAYVANVNDPTTTITMPSTNITVTATYKDQPSALTAINCGGAAYTADDGTEYLADHYFTGGSTYSTTDSTANTTDDTLYQSERYGNYTYNVPVPNGTYNILLQFAEIYETTNSARVLDVSIEGGVVVNALDIHAVAGHDTAYDVLISSITVSDGFLTITTAGDVDNPKLSAFRIMASTNTPPVAFAGTNRTVVLDVAAAPWTPSHIATEAWYDASDTNTITANSGAVSVWQDKSSNGNDASQGDSAKQPTTGATIGALNALSFDADILNTALTQLTDVSIYYVADVTLKPGNANNCPLGAATSYNQGGCFITLQDYNNPGVANHATFYGLPLDFSIGFLNGVNAATDHGFSPAIFSHSGTGLSTESLTYKIGASSASEVQPYLGTIGEIIICPSEHDEATRQKIEGYLAHKWGIEASLLSGHPYKAAAPTTASIAVTFADASVSDADAGDTVSQSWTVVSHPGTLPSFDDINRVDATATFTATGTYELRLTASDGKDTHSDDVTITVNRADQAIDFPNPGSHIHTDSFTLTATGGASGNPVTFTVTTGPASIGAGDTVTFSGVGEVTITASQAGNANYNPAPDVLQTFTVSKATPAITWGDPDAIVYGTALDGTQLNAAADTAGTFTYDPVVGTVLPAGDAQPLQVAFTPDDPANWTTAEATVHIDVTKAVLTVTADSGGKVYGEEDPGLTYSVETLVDGDALSGSLTRLAGETVGSYSIIQGSLANGNYEITFSGADFTISPRPVTLIAESAGKTYGENDPATLAVTVGADTSLAPGDTLAEVTGVTTRQPGEAIGNYDLLLGAGIKAGNYAITFDGDNDAFSIAPRLLTTTALPQTRQYTQANSMFDLSEGAGYTIDGFADGENSAVLTAQPSVSILGTATTVGLHAGVITADGAEADNYTIAYLPADLVITNAVPVIQNADVIREIAESAENGTVVGVAVSSLDTDEDETLTHSLTDDAGGAFTIDPATGQITVADTTLINYETATTAQVTVQVHDQAFADAADVASSASAVLTISILDVNDAPVMESATVDLPAIDARITDADNTGKTLAELLGDKISDVDADAVHQGVAVYQQTAGAGVWQYRNDDDEWTDLGPIAENTALLLPAVTAVRFVPGEPGGSTATFSCYAWDMSAGSSYETVDISNRGGFTAFSLDSSTVRQVVSPAIYELAYTAGENGTLENSIGDQADSFTQNIVYQQDALPVTAVPDEGYHFIQWSDGNVDNPRTDISVTVDLTVTALYSEYHALSVSGGTGPAEAYAGESVIISADTPLEVRSFSRWAGDITGLEDPNSAITSLTMQDANTTLTAIYAFEIPLAPGWNAVSLPFLPLNDDITSALNPAARSTGTDFTAWSWDGEKFMETWSLTPFQGAWIYVAAPATLFFEGTETDAPPLPTTPGWQLIGTRATTTPTNMRGQEFHIWHRPPGGAYQNTLSLHPGKAYWLWSGQ